MQTYEAWIILCAGMIVSFFYGVTTIHYKIFPYEQLRNIKLIASPNQIYSNYYFRKKSFFEYHGRHQYDVVFIGDSLTDEAEWEDLFPTLTIANRGIAGDNTDGVLNRLDSIYSTNARKAFIMLGINDFLSGADVNSVVENYRTIINKLVAHKMHVYIQSTLLVDKREQKLNIKVMALNNQLQKITEKNASTTYIDLNVNFAKASFLDPRYSKDGIHLNGKGYALWKTIIKNSLH